MKDNRNRFRPRLEALEERWAPATGFWKGTFSTDFSAGPNWSGLGGRPPSSTDDLIFDGNQGNVDCTVDGGTTNAPLVLAHSIDFQNNYTKTLHFAKAIEHSVGAGGITQSCGDIEHDRAASILGISGPYNWSGGTIDTVQEATVNLAGGGVTSNFTGTGNRTTKSNFKVPSGGTLVVQMESSVDSITFAANGNIQVLAGGACDLETGMLDMAAGGTNSFFNAGTVTVGAVGGGLSFTSQMPFKNTAGLFHVLAGETLHILQNIAAADIEVSGGTFDAEDGAVIDGSGSIPAVHVSGGNFYTEGALTISHGNFNFDGGTLDLNHIHPLATGSITLTDGSVTWTGGSWTCKVVGKTAGSSTGGTSACDYISASSSIFIGGTSDFHTKDIFGPVTPASTWSFLVAAAISGAFGATDYGYNDGSGDFWTPVTDAGASTWYLTSPPV